MRDLWLDGDTVERLLQGRILPDDAPPGYAEVAHVLRTAAAPLDRPPASLEAQHMAAARMLITQPSPTAARSTASRTTRTNGRRAKVMGLVVVGTVLSTSGLAAAGALPDAAQDALSNVLSRVGISVPQGNQPGSDAETADTAATPDSADAGKGAQISEIATTTDSTGVDKGAEISSTASDGKSQAGQHGHAGGDRDVAPVTTPNAGGTNTADEASGGQSHAGTDVAAEMSDGRSAAGSANRSSGAGQGH